MRFLVLPILPLLVATCLVIANISFGLPSNHGEHKNPINSQYVLARSRDTSDLRAVPGMAAPGVEDRHLRRKRDMLNPSNHPSTTLMQRHNHIMNTLRLHSRDSSLAKRSLAGDLVVMGFQLIWDYADVIVPSLPAFDRTSEFYRNITDMDPVMLVNCVFTYGSFRFIIGNAGPIWAQQIAPNGLEEFVKEFARFMLRLTATVVVGTYRVLAFSARASVWITMAVVEHGQEPDVIT